MNKPVGKRGRWLTLVVVLTAALGLTIPLALNHRVGNSPAAGASSTGTATHRGPDIGVPAAQQDVPMSPVTAYAGAVRAAHRDGIRVWLEIDLVKRWLAGPASFAAGVRRIGELSRQPGVVGVKIADELGYGDGLQNAAQVQAFLDAAHHAVSTAAPGKKILVDLVVPALGCVPDRVPAALWATICSARAAGDYPALRLTAIDGYLSSGDIDVLDLSTGLLPTRTYTGWGLTLDQAQQAAWQEVSRRGWGRLVTLQARKALAHPGDYVSSSATASADLTTWVDLPLRLGAGAVDVWTWSQNYDGGTYRLVNAGLRSNSLWAGIIARHRAGDRLFTHFTPSSTVVGLSADMAQLARGFTDVFVATGTG